MCHPIQRGFDDSRDLTEPNPTFDERPHGDFVGGRKDRRGGSALGQRLVGQLQTGEAFEIRPLKVITQSRYFRLSPKDTQWVNRIRRS